MFLARSDGARSEGIFGAAIYTKEQNLGFGAV